MPFPAGSPLAQIPFDPARPQAYVDALVQAGASPYIARMFANEAIILHQPQTQQAIQQAKQSGQRVELKIDGTRVRVEPDGTATMSTGSVWKPLIAAGLVMAGGYGLSTLGGTAGTTAALGPSTAANIAATSAATAAPAGIAAGTGGTVAGALGSIGWSNLIGAGTQIGGAAIQAHAAGKASDAEAQSQREALDFLKERDKRDYADQAPYRALGANAANSLGHYLGFPSAPAAQGASVEDLLAGGAKTRPPDAPITGVAIPRGSDPKTQLVTMHDSTGMERQVPSKDVMRLLAMGATLAQPTTGASAGARTGAMI